MDKPDLIEESRTLAREGRCWYCLFPVEQPPDWRFCRRMENLLPPAALIEWQSEDLPSFYHDDGRPIHFDLRFRMVEGLRAHAECEWLNNHAILIPDDVEELEMLWDPLEKPDEEEDD